MTAHDKALEAARDSYLKVSGVCLSVRSIREIITAYHATLAGQGESGDGDLVDQVQSYMDGFDGLTELAVGAHMLRLALGKLLAAFIRRGANFRSKAAEAERLRAALVALQTETTRALMRHDAGYGLDVERLSKTASNAAVVLHAALEQSNG